MEKINGQYRVTEQGELNSSHHPKTLLPMLLHMADLWHTWSHLTDIVKKGPDQNQRPLKGQLDQKQIESFLGAMHSIAQGLSREIAEVYDARPFKRLLDIGGGTGSYTIAFLEKYPHLEGVLFDLANVIPMARQRIRKQGIEDRVSLIPGDFYHDELPKGCDFALLSAIIHQNSPKQNVDIYSKIYRALNHGGTVLIRDHIMDETRTKPVDGTVFAVNMLVNTPGGDTYTFDEVRKTLGKAGFTEVRWVRVGERMDSLVEAKKIK
jgi:cyclopropane fatty-acyl-phospholipid synthase-like methyltransferase